MDESILIAIGVGFVTILLVLFLLFKRSGSSGTSVLLMGVRGSGKTLMYLQLVEGTYKETVTSLKESDGTINQLLSKPVQINVIDLPGHDRLRTSNLELFAAKAKAVIYVVDSATVVKEIKDVAEYLYAILTDASISRYRIPVLIACNKQDLSYTTKSSSIIQEKLEAELNLVRKSRSGELEGTDGQTDIKTLGDENKDFTFSQLLPQKVTLLECSALGEEAGSPPDLASVEEWILSLK